MSKIILHALFIFLVLPLAVSAQTGTSTVESVEIDGGVLHYSGDSTTAGTLVESWHDTDGDGEYDAWFVYEDEVVVQESYDTTGDGAADLVLDVNQNAEITKLSGASAATYEAPDAKPFTPEKIDISAGSDLVGDLSDIELVESTSNSWIFFVLLFLVGGALYLFWQRQK